MMQPATKLHNQIHLILVQLRMTFQMLALTNFPTIYLMQTSTLCLMQSAMKFHYQIQLKTVLGSDDLSNSCKATSSIKIGCLKRQHTWPELELDGCDFYTLTVNPLRTCSAFLASTTRKFLERVKCFLKFCHIKYPERKLDFTFVNDMDVVQSVGRTRA